MASQVAAVGFHHGAYFVALSLSGRQIFSSVQSVVLRIKQLDRLGERKLHYAS
jgi:hypothetical protein